MGAHPANTAASSAESSASLAARGSSGRNRRAAQTRAEAASGHLPAVEPDPALQPGRLRGRQRIVQASGRLGEQGLGPVDRPREHVGIRCRQPALGPPLLVGGQQRRALQERSGGGVPTTAPGPGRCRRKLGRDPFVGPGRGRGQMPGPGNYVELRIAGRREGPVGLPPLTRGRGVVDRRADERVGEPHLRPEGHHSGGLRGHRGGLRDAQRGRRLPQPIAPARLSAAASNSSVCVPAGSSRTRRTNRSSSW